MAIAAAQIGYSLRIFIVCSAFFDTPTPKPPSQKKSGGGDTEEVEKDYIKEAIKKPHADWVFINPEVLKLSRKKEKMREGCLSVRWFYGDVGRSIQAKVQAYDEKGEIFERGASGLLAQVFQHEIDHLNGILFIDKAENLKEIPPKDSEGRIMKYE